MWYALAIVDVHTHTTHTPHTHHTHTTHTSHTHYTHTTHTPHTYHTHTTHTTHNAPGTYTCTTCTLYNDDVHITGCFYTCPRYYDHKRHAANKEQKTIDASEKVGFKVERP